MPIAPPAGMDPGVWNQLTKGFFNDDVRAKAADKWSAAYAQDAAAREGTPIMSYNGYTFVRPGGDPNAEWLGGQTPVAGVDRRAWSNVANPLAFEYGGRYGGAADEAARYAGLGQDMYGRAAPQMNLDEYNRRAQAEERALGMYEGLATGRGDIPSLADAQLKAGLAQNMQNSLTLAAQARGGGASLASAQQGALNNNMQAGIQSNFQGAILRAQEQQAALQGFSGLASQRAGMAAQLAQQQAQFEAAQRGLNQQGLLGFEGMRQSVFGQQFQGQQAGEAQNAGTGLSQAQLQAQRDAADNNFYRQLIGGAITAAGTAAGGAFGGPAGAAAGMAAGNAVSGAIQNSGSSGGSGSGNGIRYRY